MRILIFSTAYLPFVGGAEVAIKEITDRIPEISFDMVTPLYDRKLPRNEKIGNVFVHRIGFGISFLDKIYIAIFGLIHAKKITKKQKIDAFWCMMVSFASGAAYIYNTLFFWKKVPTILTLQEGDSEEHIEKSRLGLIGLSWRLALKFTDCLTVISNYLAHRARHFGFDGEVSLVPNGVSVERFSKEYSQEEKDNLKKKLGIENKHVLITTSRLNIKNGIDLVIKALSGLSGDVVFLVLGEGELKEELTELAEKEGVADRVIWLGLVDHAQIPLYLSVADVFVRPSRSEGMGNSFLEAMAAGVPVVATPVGGIIDFVFDASQSKNATGFLAETGNSKSVAIKIEEAMNAESKKVATENARQLVEEKYTWNSVAQKMREVFMKSPSEIK